jgi:uncharacterized membrane protein
VTRAPDRLESALGKLLFVGVATSTVVLLVGLVWWLVAPASPSASQLLNVGLIILMLTPGLRVVVSCIEYLRERDWFFAATTAGVLIVLLTTVLVAMRMGR